MSQNSIKFWPIFKEKNTLLEMEIWLINEREKSPCLQFQGKQYDGRGGLCERAVHKNADVNSDTVPNFHLKTN